MKKLTISQIANLAGVSKATVSRVLNGYPHISPEIREKVQAVIQETGFQRNNVARLLASNRSNIIGLVIPSGAKAVFTDPYFPAVTQGITQFCNQNQLTLALFVFHSEDEGMDTIKNILTAGLVDGLVITADRKDDYFIPRLIEHQMPFVVLGRPEKNIQDISYVDTDNVGGAYMATKHLLELGHRRIGIVACNTNSAGDDRYKGYLQALEEYDIDTNPCLIAYGDFSLNSGYEATKRLIPEKPDAIFVSSDTMALGGLQALREVGLTIPDDIAIVGYDDLPPAVQAGPPLTTVRQPIEKSGLLAAEILMGILDEEITPPHQVVLPNQLIIRASSGAT